MAEALLMIALSPTMTEGSIARWKKQENEVFSSGDLLCEVETDKASMDYEAPKNGVLLKILVPQGGKAEVGQPIAVIGKAGEDPDSLSLSTGAKPASTPAPQASSQASVKATLAKPAAEKALPSTSTPNQQTVDAQPSSAAHTFLAAQAPSAPAGYPRSSPLARKVALELGIDLRLVRGSGPEGRVTEKDVRTFASSGLTTSSLESGAASTVQPPATPRETAHKPIGAKRAVIAKRLGESFFSAPHYYLRKEIKVDSLLDARAEVNKDRPKPISFNAVLIKLAANALARHPEINVYWMGDSIEERRSVDIGLAVALPDGLITPVVRDCDLKGLEQIDEELSALVEKAKTKGLSPAEYEGAGFTISNLGLYGIESFTPVINPPQVALLGVNAITERIRTVEGQITAYPAMGLSLTYDHRAVDGAPASRFLKDLVTALEHFDLLLIG